MPPQEGPERRARITREIMARTGIDEALIERLVRRFYEQVQSDPILGPVFTAKIADWNAHIEKMRDFWSSVALMSGRYHGQIMQAHLVLHLGRTHFDRWLTLFEKTASELCPSTAADYYVERAQRIAASLETGIAAGPGDAQSSSPTGAPQDLSESRGDRSAVPDAATSIGGLP
jgi:hemoglobin